MLQLQNRTEHGVKFRAVTTETKTPGGIVPPHWESEGERVIMVIPPKDSNSSMKLMRGFTLVELLIVLAIGGIIAVAVGPAINHFPSGNQLDDVAGDLKQTIQLARERAVAGIASSTHGIFLEMNTSAPDRDILFRGATYVGRDPLYDQPTTISGSINLTATLTGNASAITFTPRWGIPSATGTITLTHSTGDQRVLRLNDLGFITTE